MPDAYTEGADQSVVSVYALDDSVDFKDWTEAWTHVDENYGFGAICRNVLQAQITPVERKKELRKATNERTRLCDILHEERLSGATHAFVQPVKGAAIYGISLKELCD